MWSLLQSKLATTGAVLDGRGGRLELEPAAAAGAAGAAADKGQGRLDRWLAAPGKDAGGAAAGGGDGGGGGGGGRQSAPGRAASPAGGGDGGGDDGDENDGGGGGNDGVWDGGAAEPATKKRHVSG
jgi:hypothetical protein